MNVNHQITPSPGLKLISESESIIKNEPRPVFSRKRSLIEYREKTGNQSNDLFIGGVNSSEETFNLKT